jgi:Fe-S cluster assembly ATP-binding protein
MLELKDITLRLEDGRTILDGVSMTLEDKKIIAVTGPNGSGKSSLARIIMGLQQPTSGCILLNGQDITDMDITERARLGIGYAFQNPPRFKGIKVGELLKLSCGGSKDKGGICDMLYSVGLCAQDYLNRDADATLSGGEAKRIEIATVLARSLKLAVFDEPEAGIDLWSFQKLADTFREMHGKTDTTIVIISHQERILELADDILLMKDGHLTPMPREEILAGEDFDARCQCRLGCGKRGQEHAECVG